MNASAATAAFAAGLAVVGWVGWGYLGTSPLALAMTLAIAVFYVMGALELRRFHRASTTLHAALAGTSAAPIEDLPAWLAQLDPALRVSVRARIEGERGGLPGPAMAPYLVGLLVLLGMLGTFLGMVVTLNGAVAALEGTTDLAAIRAALAAPVKGLGLAFGTSVAGVAASAMLGLVSALCRRDRLLAVHRLDAAIATRLRAHTPAHERASLLQAVQAQARLVPEVVAQMQGLAAVLQHQGDNLGRQLLAGQDRFHDGAQASYAQLAASVDRTLQQTVERNAQAVGAALQPAVQASLDGIVRETARFREDLEAAAQRQSQAVAGAVQHQLDGVGAAVQRQLDGVADAVQRQLAGAAAQMAASVAATDRAQAAMQAEAAAREQARLAAWSERMDAVATMLHARWQQAADAVAAQQAGVCATLERSAAALHEQAAEQAQATIAELSRLAATAAEAPRAAAEVVARLREQLSQTLARDNGLLEERARVMGTLDTLLAAVTEAATGQRAAVDALVSSAADVLQRAGVQFGQQMAAASARVEDAAAHVAEGATDVAGLSAAFGTAVQLFGDTSQALAGQLQRIEGALDRSSVRSDEQLAYYVAQAREIVDLTLSSQKQIVEDLHRLSARTAPAVGEPA